MTRQKEAGRTEAERDFWTSVNADDFHWYWIGEGLSVKEARQQSWAYVYAPLLDGYFLEVWCGDEDCIRPHHTFIGKLDDAAFAIKKRQEEKRNSSLELNVDARKKVTDDDVDQMRELHEQGMNYAAIGRLFGVSRKAAREIVLGMSRSRKADKKTGRLYTVHIDSEEEGNYDEHESREA